MDRRSILKSLIAAPVAALTFNKVKAEEKITYGKIDLDEPLGSPWEGTIACSGYYMDSGVILYPKCGG